MSVQGLLPIEFSLEYNSLRLNNNSSAHNLFGLGWSDSRYVARLEELSSSDVRIHWSLLRYNNFTAQGGGSYRSSAQECFYAELTKHADNTYTLRRQNNDIYEFDSQGKLTALGNHRGQQLALSYDLQGRLQQVTDTVGGVYLLYGYNNDNQVETVTDSAGRVATLSYDSDGTLKSHTDAAGFTTHYTYYSPGTQQIRSATNDESDQLFYNTYDKHGRVKTQDDGRSDNQLFRGARKK